MKISTFHWLGLATGLLLSAVAIGKGCPAFFTPQHLEALHQSLDPYPGDGYSMPRPVGTGGLLHRSLPQEAPGP